MKVGLKLRQSGAQIACRWGWGGDFCTNRRQRKLAAGIVPKPKGRPRKAEPDKFSMEYYKAENERLKMENELLRDFLQSIERE